MAALQRANSPWHSGIPVRSKQDRGSISRIRRIPARAEVTVSELVGPKQDIDLPCEGEQILDHVKVS
jgi:hypothetical protein